MIQAEIKLYDEPVKPPPSTTITHYDGDYYGYGSYKTSYSCISDKTLAEVIEDEEKFFQLGYYLGMKIKNTKTGFILEVADFITDRTKTRSMIRNRPAIVMCYSLNENLTRKGDYQTPYSLPELLDTHMEILA